MTHGFIHAREFPTPKLPNGFRVTKPTSGSTMEAICEVLPHAYGWELRLTIDGRPRPMSLFVDSVNDVLTALSRWRAAMNNTGWR